MITLGMCWLPELTARNCPLHWLIYCYFYSLVAFSSFFKMLCVNGPEFAVVYFFLGF